VRRIELGWWHIMMMHQRPTSSHPQPIRLKAKYCIKRIFKEKLWDRTKHGTWQFSCSVSFLFAAQPLFPMTYDIYQPVPLRHMAGSSRSGRFVAARTKTPRRGSSPSSSVRRVLTTRTEDSESVSSRLGTSASSWSKMMMHREEARARANT
jgi:hypothetical protein